MDFDPDRAFDPHGRGIAVARLSSFDDLEYIGDGNEVVATVNKRLDAECSFNMIITSSAG